MLTLGVNLSESSTMAVWALEGSYIEAKDGEFDWSGAILTALFAFCFVSGLYSEFE